MLRFTSIQRERVERVLNILRGIERDEKGMGEVTSWAGAEITAVKAKFQAVVDRSSASAMAHEVELAAEGPSGLFA